MCTFVSHTVMGLCAGYALAPRNPPVQYWLVCALLPALPDLDVIGFWLDIPYEHILGHRGISHSLLAGVLLGAAFGLLLRREVPQGPHRHMLVVFALLGVSHGLLDTFTNGGLGIALLAPFDNARYFAWVTPIQVSPIGLRAFFSPAGLETAISELRWVIAPSLALALLAWPIRRLGLR